MRLKIVSRGQPYDCVVHDEIGNVLENVRLVNIRIDPVQGYPVAEIEVTGVEVDITAVFGKIHFEVMPETGGRQS